MFKKKNTNYKLIFSISSNPSNKGINYYNSLFKKRKINAIYMSLKIIKKDHLKLLFKTIDTFLFNFYGMSISMPFKIEAVKYLDKKDISVNTTGAVNTIISNEGKLKGYNTDYMAINKILSKYNFINRKIFIYGNGAMAINFIHYFSKITNCQIYVNSRNNKKLQLLKRKFKFINILSVIKIKNSNFSIFINATPVTSNNNLFDKCILNNSALFFDCPIKILKKTFLQTIAHKYKKTCIDGNQLYSNQRFFQEKIYLNGL